MKKKLNGNLYTCEQVRRLDQEAIENHQISGAVLMERAGEAAFRLLKERWPEAKLVVVVCGLGNNAGDGYVLARLAHQANMQVVVVQLGDDGRLRGDALKMYRAAKALEMVFRAYAPGALPQADVYVDALFGTGLVRTIESPIRTAGQQWDRTSLPRSVHSPQGLLRGSPPFLGPPFHC